MTAMKAAITIGPGVKVARFSRTPICNAQGQHTHDLVMLECEVPIDKVSLHTPEDVRNLAERVAVLKKQGWEFAQEIRDGGFWLTAKKDGRAFELIRSDIYDVWLGIVEELETGDKPVGDLRICEKCSFVSEYRLHDRHNCKRCGTEFIRKYRKRDLPNGVVDARERIGGRIEFTADGIHWWFANELMFIMDEAQAIPQVMLDEAAKMIREIPTSREKP